MPIPGRNLYTHYQLAKLRWRLFLSRFISKYLISVSHFRHFYLDLLALDPASPYFENKHVDRRVDPSDADFVDVIHTDGRTVIINGFGTVQPMGHIDFFPNGGYHQVGCEKIDISKSKD